MSDIQTQEPFLTRRQVVEVVNRELGIPLSMERINRSASKGTGPKPAAVYGRVHLYTRPVVLEWARGLIAPVSTA